MRLNKIEIEKNEYFTFDNCEFQRTEETTIINNKEDKKTYWFYKSKPSENNSGAHFSYWQRCSEKESEDMENKYNK